MVSRPTLGHNTVIFADFNLTLRQDQPNGQIEEIENKMSDDEIEIDTELPCKIEPTESAELTNNISKVKFSYLFFDFQSLCFNTFRNFKGVPVGFQRA